MAGDRTSIDSYTGRGGQMATLAEVLMRHCNVAVPEVDEGEDVFAFVTGHPEVSRIQVKTANAEPLKAEGRYAARVSVPLEQLREPRKAPLHYVFPVRLGERWTDFVVISREELYLLYQSDGIGYENQKAGELQLYLSFGPTSLVCSKCDLQPYRNAWNQLAVFARAAEPAGTAGRSAAPQG